jgi:hypothetical protein
MENEHTASTFSFATPDWVKSFNGVPRNLYGALSKEALGFTASCLQDQADYLKKLAESATPAEALKCQMDFVQQSWWRYFSEGWHVVDALRKNQPSGSAPIE